MKKENFTNTKLGAGQIALYYMGQVGFVLRHKDTFILVDGYLSDYVDRHCARPGVEWKRKYPAPIHPEALDFIDYVFCTHAHFDHADPDTLKAIHDVNPKAQFFVSAAIRDTILSYGISPARVTGLRCDAPFSLCEDIEVTAIPAAHEELHMDANGDYSEVGFRFRLGDISLFHGGDGCPYDGLSEKIKGSDILLLPVNGRDYFRTYVQDIIGNFTDREAVLLAKECGADLLIPTHFDLYAGNGLAPSAFVETLYAENPTQKFHMFMPGERLIYAK